MSLLSDSESLLKLLKGVREEVKVVESVVVRNLLEDELSYS